jgi:zinc protease
MKTVSAALASVLMATASLAALAPAAAQARAATARAGQSLIPVQTFTLPNGLRVVFHIDRSDPVAA